MAGGKVSEWIRKRTMPRRKGRSGASAPILEDVTGSGTPAAPMLPRRKVRSGASAPILEEVTGSGTGTPAAAMFRKAAGRGARSEVSSARRWRPRVNVLAVLYDKVVYHLMWLVESVVVVARLCFFLMRFGFKQL